MKNGWHGEEVTEGWHGEEVIEGWRGEEVIEASHDKHPYLLQDTTPP